MAATSWPSITPNFTAPTKLNLPARAATPGFTPLKTGPAGQGPDYLRDNLFPVSQMKPIPDEGGSGVTLKNLLDGNIKRALADTQSVVLALGQFFQDPGADETFHFSPELGIHDIHMMQGNKGSFADDNTVNGDGRLLHPLHRRRKPSPSSSASIPSPSPPTILPATPNKPPTSAPLWW